MDQGIYTGVLLPPGINFGAVRDGRRAPILYFDVDLSTARSKALNTAVLVPVAGDSFYSDLDPDNGGWATVYFQDTSWSGTAAAPVRVNPGTIINAPFTQLLIENTAQAGKRMRVFYGVGLDFKPGSASVVQISGVVSVQDLIGSAPVTLQQFATGTAVGGLVAVQMLAPASNTLGITVKSAWTGAIAAVGATAVADGSVIAAKSAPTSFAAANQVNIARTQAVNGASQQQATMDFSRFLPAGYGLYLCYATSNVAGANYYAELTYQ